MSDYSEAIVQQDYIRTLFTTLRRRWVKITISTILLFLVLAIGIQFLPRTYNGVASVEVLTKTPTVSNSNLMPNDDVLLTDDTLGTELGIFTSREVRTRVIQKLNLLTIPEFNPDLHQSTLDTVVATISPLLDHLPPTMAATVRPWLPKTETASNEKILFDVLQVFATRVLVEPVSHSKIIQITVSSHNPTLAAQIANTVATEYIAERQALKEAVYRQAFDFTNQRLPAMRAEMIAKTNLVNEFRQKNNFIFGQYASIRREKLSEASRQLLVAQNKLEDLRGQVAASARGDIMSNPAVLASVTIERLREQEAQLASTGHSPLGDMRVQTMEASIRAEAQRVIKSLPNLVLAQDEAVRNQQKLVDAMLADVSKMDSVQAQLNLLENDASIASARYSDFLNSDNSSRPDVIFAAVNVRVLSSASVPYQAQFPNNKLMLPAAGVLSFLLMCGLTLYRRDGFATSAQFHDAFRIEPIGSIPYRTRAMEQTFWEAVMFVSMKLAPPHERTQQTILITSSRPNEGKTTIAQGLAEMFARRNISVVLVDADLRISRRMEKQQPLRIGLADVLNDDAPLDRVIQKKNGISVINSGSRGGVSQISPLFASERMPELLARLRTTHDIIIIDGPPAPIGSDSWVLSKLANKVLCVVAQGTEEVAIQNTLRLINTPNIDVVLNMVRVKDDPMISAMLEYSKQRKG